MSVCVSSSATGQGCSDVSLPGFFTGVKMKSAGQMSAAWAAAMGSATSAQKYKDGVNGYSGNPMALAASADAQQRYAANTAAAVASGRMAAKLNSVPVQTWKDNATTVGSQRFATGATKAKAKVDRHFQQWAPIYQQMSDAARSLPKGGVANALARVQAAITIAMQAAGKQT